MFQSHLGIYASGENQLIWKKYFMAISKKQVIESINAMPEEEFNNTDVLL
jgi:hypothetical protein